MLTSEEVYAIMKEDILELQRKRIKELEESLMHSTQIIKNCVYGPTSAKIVSDNTALIKKGISV